jgi:hypothetical protein
LFRQYSSALTLQHLEDYFGVLKPGGKAFP